MTKRIGLLIGSMMLLSALCFAGAAGEFKGWLVDNACAGRMQNDVAKVKGHTKGCALMPACKGSGYGILTSDGKFYKLNAAGNEQAVKLLESTKSEKGLQVQAKGELSGETLNVTEMTEVK